MIPGGGQIAKVRNVSMMGSQSSIVESVANLFIPLWCLSCSQVFRGLFRIPQCGFEPSGERVCQATRRKQPTFGSEPHSLPLSQNGTSRERQADHFNAF